MIHFKRNVFLCMLCIVLLALLNIRKIQNQHTVNATAVYLNSSDIYTPKLYRRALNSTLLSFPEWYLVYSPAAYAEFTRDHFPSQYPFYGDIWQYWESYAAVNRLAAPLNQFNMPDQVMLMVIGVSTTIEYSLRGFYERTIGQLSALISGRVPEDKYAAAVAQQYVDFIKKEPWYEFNFLNSFKGLWLKTPFFGHGLFRKLERKYILSTEYLVKYLYAQLIKLGTHSAYGVASTKTAVLISGIKNNPLQAKGMRLEKHYNSGLALLLVPRLDAFAPAALYLAKKNIQFHEIAGNNAFICLSVLASNHWANPCSACHIVYQQPVLIKPGIRRYLMSIPIKQLSQSLLLLGKEPIVLEHLYDY